LGAAVRLVGPCPGCAEWRCATHCWHGRNGKKRNDEDQPASKKPKTKKTAAKLGRLRAQQQQRPLPLLVREPQPPKRPLEVLKGAAFWDSALREVSAAKKSVFVTSLAYDNTRLQQKLVAALARGVKVVVLVRGIRKQLTPSMTDLVQIGHVPFSLQTPGFKYMRREARLTSRNTTKAPSVEAAEGRLVDVACSLHRMHFNVGNRKESRASKT